jgi:hypothetical protein
MSSSSADALSTKMPGDAVTVTNWYKQDVYDSSNNKIGEIVDVLVNKSGQVTTAIVSVGGFLGMDSGTNADKWTFTHGWTPKPSPHDIRPCPSRSPARSGALSFWVPTAFLAVLLLWRIELDNQSEQF